MISLLILFGFWLLGQLISFGVNWATAEDKFLVRKTRRSFVLLSGVGLVLAIACYFLGLTHFAFWFLLAVGGFLCNHIFGKLDKWN